MISSECAEPLAGKFRTLAIEQNVGFPMRDASLNLAERVPLIDVRSFVTALSIRKKRAVTLRKFWTDWHALPAINYFLEHQKPSVAAGYSNFNQCRLCDE